MAKKQLTIEEKLQAALVPAEERPYKVPENWCWVKFSVTYDNVSSSKNKIKQKDYQNEGKFAIVDQGENLIGGYSNNEGIVYDGELPVIIFGDHTRRIKYVDFPFIQGADGVKVLQPKNYIVPRYYFFCLQSMQIPHMGYRRHFPILNKMGFPIAPIDEQSRIVARIEALFAKLDEAKEKIQEVLDGADLRRAAILHQAFTGKLTEKWRRENGVSDDSREKSNVKSICNSLKYGTAKKSVQDGDVAVLRMGNLQNGEIDWDSLVYSNDQDDIEKYSLKDGDVLFNRTNSAELVGKTSIYRGERPAIYAGHLIKLDYKRDKIIGDFFNYMLNSPKAKEYCNKVKTDGVNQSNINAKKIGAFEFDVPTILEQQELVRLLDNLLSREQSTVTACEEALTTIATLKKSILARAFRGELGTNDPSDPSAKELLREILSA